jgi:hypothetical protein
VVIVTTIFIVRALLVARNKRRAKAEEKRLAAASTVEWESFLDDSLPDEDTSRLLPALPKMMPPSSLPQIPAVHAHAHGSSLPRIVPGHPNNAHVHAPVHPQAGLGAPMPVQMQMQMPMPMPMRMPPPPAIPGVTPLPPPHIPLSPSPQSQSQSFASPSQAQAQAPAPLPPSSNGQPEFTRGIQQRLPPAEGAQGGGAGPGYMSMMPESTRPERATGSAPGAAAAAVTPAPSNGSGGSGAGGGATFVITDAQFPTVTLPESDAPLSGADRGETSEPKMAPPDRDVDGARA